MIDNQYEWVKKNYISNIRRIQNDVLETIYEFKFVRDDRKKITKSKTRKNGDTRVRNQGDYVNTSDDVEKLNN